MDLDGHFHALPHPASPPRVQSYFASPDPDQGGSLGGPNPPSQEGGEPGDAEGGEDGGASMAEQAAGGTGVGTRGSGKLPRTYSWPERPQSVVRSRKQVCNTFMRAVVLVRREADDKSSPGRRRSCVEHLGNTEGATGMACRLMIPRSLCSKYGQDSRSQAAVAEGLRV